MRATPGNLRKPIKLPKLHYGLADILKIVIFVIAFLFDFLENLYELCLINLQLFL